MGTSQVSFVPVVIIGGGPVGTILSALLSRNYKIANTVLEKETEIPTEPRAFAFGEHGIRVLQSLGIYNRIYDEIAMAVAYTELISGTHHDINHPPFMRKNLSQSGVTCHNVSSRFKQAKMEEIVREVIQEAEVGTFREGCEVFQIQEKEDGFVHVKYLELESRVIREIKTRFVIATDGRRGFTRKKYLEPKGVKLERVHPYSQVFLGANWLVSVPTPESHPEFPLWKLGYSPEDAVNEFFSFNMKLLCNPERQLIASRVCLKEDNPFFFRTEFSTKPFEDPQKLSQPDIISGFLRPYMKQPGSRYGLSEDVAFPENCMKIGHTWHYTYESLICNMWNAGRVMLAGDSAHVIAPLGGLGITAGALDVAGLAWRLAIALLPSNVDRPFTEISPFFTSWAEERKGEIAQSRRFSMRIGSLLLESNPVKIFVRDWTLWILRSLPLVSTWIEKPPVEELTYANTENSAFCSNLQGGISLYQVFCRRLVPNSPLVWSDEIIYERKTSLFQLLVLVDDLHQVSAVFRELQFLEEMGDDAALMSSEATILIHNPQITTTEAENATQQHANIARVATVDEFIRSPLSKGREEPTGYDWRRLRIQYGGCRYIIVRPDRVVFAACNYMDTLVTVLQSIRRVMRCEPADIELKHGSV